MDINNNFFDEFEEQSQTDFRGLNFLNIENIQSGNLSNTSLRNIKTNQSFAEIRNEIALEFPTGKNSVLYKSIFITKNIDFVRLADFLKEKADFVYDYKKFIGKDTFIFTTVTPLYIAIPVTYNSENPLILNTFYGEKKLELKGKLYNEIGIVNSVSDFKGDDIGGFEFKFNYKKKELEYIVHYYFVGKKRVYEKENIDHIAFTISSSSFDDLNAFLNLSSRKPSASYLEIITKDFTSAIKEVSEQDDMIPIQKNYDERKTLNTRKLNDLDWLYQNIPSFAAVKLNFDQTIQNVFKLSSYDKGSLTDTTKSITSVLSRLDAQKVYSYFLENPQKLINLLSGFSNDELVKNFCKYLTALTLNYINPDKKNARRFNRGENTHIETNILVGDEEGKVELKNEFQLPMIGFNSANLINLFSKDIEINNPNNKSNQFHPLELIYLTHYDENLKKAIEIPTIALYAKYLGDNSEWSDVLDATLAVIDIISIVFSGVAISSGAKGVARLFAVADITVGTINLALLSPDLRAQLNKTEAGRWLVNHWGLISFCMSAGTISYYLAKGIVKYHKQVQQQLKNEPQLSKQIDELVEESKKVVEMDLRTLKTFPLGSELEVLSSNLLRKYIRELDEIMLKQGYKLEIEWIDETHKMYLTRLKGRVVVETDGPIKLLLRKDCPKMAWFHEKRHIEDLLKYGRKKYRKMAFDEPWTLEWNVWEEIFKNRNKYREVELVSAYNYVKSVYRKENILNLFKENKVMEQLMLKYK